MNTTTKVISRKLKKQKSSDFVTMLFQNMEKRSCVLISIQSFSRTTPKLLNTSATKAYLRIGRCVVKITSNSSATLPIQVVEDISRNILLCLLACHRYIMKIESSRGDSLPKEKLSDSMAMTKRKYLKTSLSELMSIVSRFPDLMHDIYFVIPRVLEVDCFQSVSSIAKRIFTDYIEYIQYFGSLSDAQDGAVQRTLLIDYVRQSTLPMYRRLKRASASAT